MATAGTLSLILLAGILHPALGHSVPSTQPSANYRMVARIVSGAEPLQWVLVIIRPDGFPEISTAKAVTECIQRNVPAGSTLEWMPSDIIIGGEPLRTAEELRALREFCEQHKIAFIHVPAG